MTCILEINDSAITLYKDTRVLQRSPGVALVESGRNGEVLFGARALQQSRIHPRQTNQQYFSRLSAEALPAPGPRARNQADLVYLHLCELKADIDREGGGAVLLAVPGVLSADQLGVLLGVLQEVGVTVNGFVDAAVAALVSQPVRAEAYHLDVMWQRAVITTLSANHEIAKSTAQEVADCGVSRLLEGWINVIADRFVRETRFDPLHAAATEQQLFDQLYGWVEGGAAAPELAIAIHHGQHTPRVEIGRALLEDKATERLQPITDAIPGGAQVHVSARAARLPGVRRILQQAGATVETLPDDALPRGCLEHLQRIVSSDGDLRLITRLPRAAAAPAPDPAAAAPAPTHALFRHQAWPLESGPLPVRRAGEALLLDAAPDLRVNDQPLVGPHTLACGDQVSAGGRDYLIIAVQGTRD